MCPSARRSVHSDGRFVAQTLLSVRHDFALAPVDRQECACPTKTTARMLLDGCEGFQYGGPSKRGDMKVLFVASEGLPFSKTGGLADVIEALPKALVALGHEVAVLLPRYRDTKAGALAAPGLTIPMGDTLR